MLSAVAHQQDTQNADVFRLWQVCSDTGGRTRPWGRILAAVGLGGVGAAQSAVEEAAPAAPVSGSGQAETAEELETWML